MSREIEEQHHRLAEKDREVERLLKRSSSRDKEDFDSRRSRLKKSRSLDTDEEVCIISLDLLLSNSSVLYINILTMAHY